MIDHQVLVRTFETARTYNRYVATGTPEQQAAWSRIYEQVLLTDAQRGLLRGFVREINVLVVSGIWCGDCVQQCPLVQRIAESNTDKIHVRFVDRDERGEFSALLRINAGNRVPVALFLAEDLEFVSALGDRTLTRYRALAARQLGPTCPLPGAPVADDELAETLQDWVNEFERVQLLLRLSTRLRQKHGD